MNETQTTAEALEAAALTRRGAVHANPSEPCAEAAPVPEAVSKKPVDQKSPAEWAYQRVIMYLKNFEEQLDAEHEVAMGFTGGDMGVLRIQGVGFYAPDIITFYGIDQAGAKTQLIQHVNQLNVMLRTLPKPKEQPEPMRIGFQLAAALEENT
jgi:hypothetical protein